MSEAAIVPWPHLEPASGSLTVRIAFRQGMERPLVIFRPDMQEMSDVTGCIRLPMPQRVLQGMNVRLSLFCICIVPAAF